MIQKFNDFYLVDADYFEKDDYGYCTEVGQTIQNVYSKSDIDKIIGHPVHIGDVLEYITIDDYFEIVKDLEIELLELWGNKRTPIEEQSDDCIDYVYNLIKE